MTKPSPSDLDISDILARKAEGRADAAKRTFGEKIAIVEALREAVAPIQKAREAREQDRKPPRG